MGDKKASNSDLRRRAEAKLKHGRVLKAPLSVDKAMSLLQELEIHQVELEMQNEELRETQHRLEEVRDQYTDLFDFAPIGYLIVDEKGFIKNLNLTACDMLGVERLHLKGKAFTGFMDRKESVKLILNLREAFTSGILSPFELQIRPNGKEKFPALIQGTVSDEASGSGSCRIAMQNIASLKAAEALKEKHVALQKEKERIQQYLELAPIAFLLLDNDQCVRMINQKGCELLGFDRTEIIGKNWFQHFIENAQETEKEGVFKTISHRKLLLVPELESKVKCKDGSRKLVAWTNTTLMDKSGNIIGTLSAGEDITDRKRLEDTKHRYTLGLEEIVKERTKELSDALESEKQINELKTAFVSIASHELRTPITIVMSSIILIEKYLQRGQFDLQQRHIDRIKSSVNHFRSILEDFLSLDKLERGAIRVKGEVVEVQGFVESILEDLEGLLKPGQQINYTHKGDGTAVVDKKIMRNIFLNLLSNAIKFSEKDVEVVTEIQNAGLVVSVKDQGLGIPGEEQDLLFKRFFRAKNVEHIQGTGLGLSIVSRYLDLLGGNIDFFSKLGEGSTFTIHLPQGRA